MLPIIAKAAAWMAGVILSGSLIGCPPPPPKDKTPKDKYEVPDARWQKYERRWHWPGQKF
jgi:hypothetical protein